MQEVYLIISNYKNRSKVHGVCTKDKAVEQYNIICGCKPETWLEEKLSNFNVKYYSIDDDGNKTFQEQIYIEKKCVLGS